MTEKFSHSAPEIPESERESPVFLKPRDWHYEYLITFRYWLACAGVLLLPIVFLSVLAVLAGIDMLDLTAWIPEWAVYVAYCTVALLGITLNVGPVVYYCPHCGARTNEGFSVCQRCGRNT
jgi:hypothetical protein